MDSRVTERGAHHNGLVSVLLVVVVNLLHRLDTRVLLCRVVLASLGLVEVKNAADLQSVRNVSKKALHKKGRKCGDSRRER